jgi:hypothetical protein
VGAGERKLKKTLRALRGGVSTVLATKDNEWSSPSHGTEEQADEPHADRQCRHIGVVNVGYGGSDFWEGAVLIFDCVEVKFHSAGGEREGIVVG